MNNNTDFITGVEVDSGSVIATVDADGSIVSQSETPHSKLQTPNSSNSAGELVASPSGKKSLTPVFGRLTAFVRSSDPGQRRAGGNILRFLAALLALTLVARGTSGATLARVEVSIPTRSNIVEAVSGSATVSSRDQLDVTAPDGLTIVEMLADVGKNVKTGDAIIVFDKDEVIEKLMREAASLEKMLLDLDKLEREELADSSSVESARRTLRRAREDYETTRAQGESDVAAARDALDEALDSAVDDPDATALQNAIRSLHRAQEDYDSTVSQGESDIADALAALEDAKAAQLGYVDYSVIQSAERSLQRAREDMNSTRVQNDADVNAAWDSLRALEEAGAEGRQIEQAWTAIATAQRRADENLLTAKRRIEDAETALEKAELDYERNMQQALDAKQSDIDRASDTLESAKAKAEDNLLSAQRRLEDAEIAYEKAEQDYINNSEQLSETKESDIDKARNALENAQTKAAENLLSARRRVEDAEVSLAKAEQDFDKSEQQLSDSSAQNETSASTLRLDIDAQKTVVDTLEDLMMNGCVLYSDIEGTISSVSPEGSVTGAAPLVSFMDGAKGFEAHMQISKNDADKLAVGDECEVTASGGSMYFTPTVTGAISGISLPDANDRSTVTIRLPGSDWTQGQRAEAQVVLSSGSYDLCVPVSALHSDNTGYYLLTVERQSTILGLQNVVTRVNVNVVASDSDTVSVRGPVDRDSLVITGSNKTVAAGDRVRVSD